MPSKNSSLISLIELNLPTYNYLCTLCVYQEALHAFLKCLPLNWTRANKYEENALRSLSRRVEGKAKCTQKLMYEKGRQCRKEEE